MLNPFLTRLVLPGCGKGVRSEGGENSLPRGQIPCGQEIVSVKFASLVAAPCYRSVLGLNQGGEPKSGPENGVPPGLSGAVGTLAGFLTGTFTLY